MQFDLYYLQSITRIVKFYRKNVHINVAEKFINKSVSCCEVGTTI